VLSNASSSSEHSSRRLRSHISNGGDNLKDFISEELVKKGLGIQDAKDSEIQLIVDNPSLSSYYFSDMISRRARIGWSSHGHSAVDVNIYGSAGSEALHGNHENVEVGKFLRDYLDVDVDSVTEELVEKSKSFKIAGADEIGWTGKIPSEEILQSVEREHQMEYGMVP
jgi:alkaline phosphatase